MGGAFRHLVCLVIVATISLGSSNELRINSVDAFIEFARSGEYTGTTVYLESDLDFEELSSSYNPKNSFRGTFDGQGHVISKLSMDPLLGDSGLFSYSTGMTVKNLVIDSSCTVTNSKTNDENVRFGSIAGYIDSKNEHTHSLIENIVNMADVSFNGNINKELFFGGIVGGVRYSGQSVTIKNCVNYGVVKFSGNVGESAYIGGIVGYSYTNPSSFIHVQNCLNYGSITADKSGSLYVGGIVGHSTGTTLTNCVSAGKIVSKTNNIGIIAGHTYSNTSIIHCLWTSDVEYVTEYGTGTSPFISNSSLVTIDSVTVDELNKHAESNEWNKWLLNKDNHLATFKVNDTTKGFTLSSQLMLLPYSDVLWNKFAGWYTDNTFETPFDSTTVNEDMTLYGRFSKCIVTFDLNGGNNISYASKEVVYNGTYGKFPQATKTGYSLVGWFTERNGGVKIELNSRVIFDHTLYARWIINNYTVTFDFMNGTRIENSIEYNETIIYPDNFTIKGYTFNGWNPNHKYMPDENVTILAQLVPNKYTVTFNVSGGEELLNSTKEVTFNGTYGELPTPNKSGYVFSEWLNDNNIIVVNKTVVNIPNNHTLYAQWKEISLGSSSAQWKEISSESSSNEASNSIIQVEIIFNTNNLTKEGIKEIIEKFTNDNFVILIFEAEDTSNEIRIIIKFTDKEQAENFIENIKGSSDTSLNNIIKKVDYIHERIGSLSSVLYPMISFHFLIMLLILCVNSF